MKTYEPKTLPSMPADVSLFDEGDFYVPRNEQSLALYLRRVGADGKAPDCDDDCAKVWPPFLASESATDIGPWTILRRAGRPAQWAFEGRAVHTFAKDQPGGHVGAEVGTEWEQLRFRKKT